MCFVVICWCYLIDSAIMHGHCHCQFVIGLIILDQTFCKAVWYHSFLFYNWFCCCLFWHYNLLLLLSSLLTNMHGFCCQFVICLGLRRRQSFDLLESKACFLVKEREEWVAGEQLLSPVEAIVSLQAPQLQLFDVKFLIPRIKKVVGSILFWRSIEGYLVECDLWFLRLANFVHFFGVGSGLTIPRELLVVCVGEFLLTFSHIVLNSIFNCLFWLRTAPACMFHIFGQLEGRLVRLPCHFWSCFCWAIFWCNFLFTIQICLLNGVIVVVVLGCNIYACAMSKLSLFVWLFQVYSCC